MSTTENTSTRIAVFIDFDNVEIGVKNTIGGQFDIGLVLEAIKERGEIVTKIAYSDWKRVGDYSRLLTQHAIRMVQRNMTPGGDKNGADITMALDALEMCFTHDHINAFVIVGGDSDFISLVEKLKQYGRKVIVVGGRQFTSVTMQRNCHEFIAYENLVGSSRPSGRGAERGGRPATGGTSDISKVLPLVKRALKVLSEREVAPQLGLLKSTLLQLDSTFSEREYGAGSFRDFMEKVAVTGAVTLKHAGRSMLVELSGDSEEAAETAPVSAPAATPESQPQPQPQSRPQPRPRPDAPRAQEPDMPVEGDGDDDETMPVSPMSIQDGIRAVQQALSGTVRWPLYVRQAKQVLRTAIEGFDERKYGFASVVDLLRAAGKEGVLRIERDRQGAIRVFPGPNIERRPAATTVDESGEVEEIETVTETVVADVVAEPVEDEPIVDAETVAAGSDTDAATPDAERPAAKGRSRARKPAARSAKPKAAAKTAKPRARKTSRTTASGTGKS